MSSAPGLTVVIPCSKTKRQCPLPPTSADELRREPWGDDGRLAPFALPARELYLGRQHRAMVRAVDTLREARPDLQVALAIVSAGYGVLAELDRVVPYEATLGGSRRAQVARGQELGLPAAVRELAAGTGSIIFALSAAYLAACALPNPALANAIYLTGADAEAEGAATLRSGRREARLFGKAEREIRGYVLALFLEDLARRGADALRDARAGTWHPPHPRQASLVLS